MSYLARDLIDSIHCKSSNPLFQTLLSTLLLLVGSALAMPGDIEEEGFCIDGDVVAGFCLGANYAEKVQGRKTLLIVLMIATLLFIKFKMLAKKY